ncbi:MAG: STAS domain-containing protein [FCB group bacterium]|jgi:anti-anti-sigma regulatory factor|nr:STAS domain-containing protein [FCB group bacterium]
MPVVKVTKKQVSIVLSAEATIGNVEADTLLFRQALEDHADRGRIVIDAGALEEMDTAYLQLVRCFVKSARAAGVGITFCNTPEPMRRLAKLYGVDWCDSPN